MAKQPKILVCPKCDKMFPLYMQAEFAGHITNCSYCKPEQPNQETINVIEKAERGEEVKEVRNTSELLKELNEPEQSGVPVLAADVNGKLLNETELRALDKHIKQNTKHPKLCLCPDCVPDIIDKPEQPNTDKAVE